MLTHRPSLSPEMNQETTTLPPATAPKLLLPLTSSVLLFSQGYPHKQPALCGHKEPRTQKAFSSLAEGLLKTVPIPTNAYDPGNHLARGKARPLPWLCSQVMGLIGNSLSLAQGCRWGSSSPMTWGHISQ